jgi:hypothetical protein
LSEAFHYGSPTGSSRLKGAYQVNIDTRKKPHTGCGQSNTPEIGYGNGRPVEGCNGDTTSETSAFRKVWEIGRYLKCPVAGSCLNIDDHRRILKKSGIETKGLTLFAMHEIVMSRLEDDNPLSRRVERLLQARYGDSIRDLVKLTRQQLVLRWRQSLHQGDFSDVLYFFAVYHGLEDALVEVVYGDIHMAPGMLNEKTAESRRQIARLREVQQAYCEQIEGYRHQLRALKRENKRLQRPQRLPANQDDDRASSAGRASETASEKEWREQHHSLTEKVQALTRDNEHLRLLAARLEREKAEIRQRLTDLEALNDHMKDDMEDLFSHFSALSKQPEAAADQAGNLRFLDKRVLIVGGMSKIKHLYQHLIESSGGSFEYHDGCIKNGVKKLAHQVRRSDLVLCPINCNSHGAAGKVKRLCHKHRKPLCILSNASVNAISSALFDGGARAEILPEDRVC